MSKENSPTTGFQRYLVPALSIILLVAAVGRLTLLNAAESRQIASARARATLIPEFGSFHGIGASGAALRSNPNQPGWRLLFKFRSSYLQRDLDYWNEVIRRSPERQNPIYYWGVCDSAEDCDKAQAEALFTVVGFLDPHQMRAVATATANGSALLYDPLEAILEPIKPNQDPAETAKMIDQLVY